MDTLTGVVSSVQDLDKDQLLIERYRDNNDNQGIFSLPFLPLTPASTIPSESKFINTGIS